MELAFILESETVITKRVGTSMLVVIAIVVLVQLPLARSACGQEVAPYRTNAPQQLGFAYDPEQEESPHPDSDFEWWYHFGFLRKVGSQDYTHSFVSSFQRNKKGRYLFYTLAELKSGRKYHHAVVDRALFGVSDVPEVSAIDEQSSKPPGLLSNLGNRLGRWALDALDVLPDRHEFMDPLTSPDGAPHSSLWLAYGDNYLRKQDSSYLSFYTNDDFSLKLTLRPAGPPMPVLGTGLTGLDKPEDQHYYTYPRISAEGRLIANEKDVKLEGEFWYDHQWGKVKSKTLMKWCWWGLQLSNGQNLSIFFLQDSRTGETVQQGLTLHHPDGKTEVCRDMEFTPTRKWESPNERSYAVEWEIQAPELDLTIQIRPMNDDHEIPVLLYRQIWEGPCAVEASFGNGPKVKGRGFQEMIGQSNG
jgi:predicted secreted hydrolase